MTERERLARIFGIDPMKPAAGLVAATLVALIPPMLIVSGVLVFSITVMYLQEQHNIRYALREVDGWGFPVAGYRAWLLAIEPAFDLELRRDVGVELIAAAVKAVDPTIVVEKRGDRVVRVVMKRIEIHGDEDVPSFEAGDRKRLVEVLDRVLAPLHADVGIAQMQMGEREHLGALVAAPKPEDASGSAFRDQAKVAPPDLQSLVHAGTSQLAPPNEASALERRTERLMFATGQVPVGVGTVAFTTSFCTAIGFLFAPLGGLVGAGIGAGVGHVLRRHNHRQVAGLLASALERWPFRIEGYDNWLLSGRPICDIEFRERPFRPALEKRLRAIANLAELTWLSDTVLRIESHPVLHQAEQGIRPFWGGDPKELQALASLVLVPQHDAHGIVAVRMGGYLDRRV